MAAKGTNLKLRRAGGAANLLGLCHCKAGPRSGWKIAWQDA